MEAAFPRLPVHGEASRASDDFPESPRLHPWRGQMINSDTGRMKAVRPEQEQLIRKDDLKTGVLAVEVALSRVATLAAALAG